MSSEPVTLVGQLCTPKDVFARQVPVERLSVGDVVAFAMAGAYAWNIQFCPSTRHRQMSALGRRRACHQLSKRRMR
jgi:diaminopimelate decarboxylase